MPAPGLQALTPSQLVSDLLSRDPDAASVLSEADHQRELADLSAREAFRSSLAMQAARRRFDNVRHQLDPRSRRPVRAVAGLPLLALSAGCLLMLDLFELRGEVEGLATIPLALCATTTWFMAAWGAVLADREGRKKLRNLIAAGALGLTWLIAVIPAVMPPPGSAAWWHRIGVSAILVSLIDALGAGAGALMWRTEPFRVAGARLMWQRAQRDHRKAARQEERDAEAASIAAQAWLSLVRRHAIAVYASDPDPGGPVQAALAVAQALHTLGRQAQQH